MSDAVDATPPPADPNEPQESKAVKLVNWIVKQAIGGAKVLKPAGALADEYLTSEKHKTPAEQIDALVKWSRLQNFTTGFATGVWGFAALPVTLPAGMASSLVIQARMAAAIAKIAGHDIESPAVQTFVTMTLLGGNVAKLVKAAGLQEAAKSLSKSMMAQVPAKVLMELNKQIGLQLLAKAGTAGLAGLAKFIPLVGGVVGGSVDQLFCRQVGKAAKEIFFDGHLPDDTDPDGETPPAE